MRRADRLFELLQVLRRARRPLTAHQIALQLETSRRTIYRDIAALVAQGVPIRGEAGVGYVLERGFDLPPLMFTPSEVEAIVLGASWVAANADEALAEAANDVLAKVAAVVPERLRPLMESPVVGIPPALPQTDAVDLVRLREWSRQERKLRVRYVDRSGSPTERVVWPVFVGYMEGVRSLVAWCELRGDFRIFRTDRLSQVEFLQAPYPERRSSLRSRWQATR